MGGACVTESAIREHLLRELGLRANDPGRSATFGVAGATLQCEDMLEHGAPGIHLRTPNKSPATRAILKALRCMVPWRDAVPV